MLEPNLSVTGDIESSISTITVGQGYLCDPVSFIEAHFPQTREHGALKFRLPTSTSSQFNKDNFWFYATKQVFNPPDDDLASRLEFYRLLSDFTTSRGDNLLVTFQSLPYLENRQLDLYRLFKLVQICGGFETVTATHTWKVVAREIGYKAIDENLTTALRQTYETILHPYEAHDPTLLYERSPKRPKLESPAPLILGSAQPSRRSLKNRLTKGYLLNAHHHLNLKHPITIQLLALIQPQTQVHLVVRAMFEGKAVQCDDIQLEATTSLYSISQFVDRDRVFSQYLQRKYHDVFTNHSVSVTNMETLFWKSLESKGDSLETLEVELGIDLKAKFHGAPFLSIVDDVLTRKLNGVDPTPMRDLLSPWAFENLPVLPNLIFAALSESDTTNPDLINRRGQVGMTFSLKNWRCQENFCQLVDHHILGAPKLWYIIPESQFERFEALVRRCQCYHRVHVNNNQWDGDNYKLQLSQLPPDTICQCLYLMVNTTTEPRLKQHAIDTSKDSSFVNNQEHLITPSMLKDEGIAYSLIIQYPGEYIVVPPKAYACTVSLGLNLSEEINIATPLWIKFAFEGEKWMAKQSLMPAFSSFKLLANMLNPSLEMKPFSPRVLALALLQLLKSIETELNLRKEAQEWIKEVPWDDKADDDLADDDLSWCFPLKVIVTIDDHKFCTLLSRYLADYKHHKAEVQYYYTDDKLRALQKQLESDTITYYKWIDEYGKLFEDSGVVPHLKTYKTMLSEGEAILLALYTREAALTDSTPNSPDFTKFLTMVNNLRQFVAAADAFVDECQALLAIKHSQRVRKGLEVTKASLSELIRLVQKVDELDFTLPETDQILDLQREVLNFDKALRTLLAKLRSTEVEFNDLINLGELFGIEIPALNFITRIRDRMKWHKTYSILEKGGDPFADSKDVFTLVDLEEFLSNGLRILPHQDQHMVDRVSQMIADLKSYDEEVRKMLDIRFVDDIDPTILDGLAERFRSERLFLQRDSYEQLLRVHDCRKLISKAQTFRDGSKTLTLNELKPVLSAIKDIGLPFRALNLADFAYHTETVVQRFAATLKGTQVVTTMDKSLKDINAKGAHNVLFVQKLYQLLYKADFSFSKSDDYFKCSSYQEISTEEVAVELPIYCICRELEFGTMVECETCREWYHIQCVKVSRGSKKTVNDSFVCGPCQVLESGEIDQFLKNQLTTVEFLEHAKEFDDLKVIPVPEKEAVSELVEKIKLYHRQLDVDLSNFLQSNRPNLIKLDYVRFLVRKLYGAGLLWRENLDVCLKAFNELKSSYDDVFAEKIVASDDHDAPGPIHHLVTAEEPKPLVTEPDHNEVGQEHADNATRSEASLVVTDATTSEASLAATTETDIANGVSPNIEPEVAPEPIATKAESTQTKEMNEADHIPPSSSALPHGTAAVVPSTTPTTDTC